VVLAIGVVVAVLRIADLVASQQQGRPQREEQAGEVILAKVSGERCSLGVVRRALMAAIVALIVVGAVAIALAIGLVVFLVVAEQVSQRESVMDGDVIDAGARRAVVVMEQVGRGGHSA